MASVLSILIFVSVTVWDHWAGAQEQSSFSLQDLDSSDLLATGNASVNGSELSLTSDNYLSYGRIMKKQRVQLCDSAAGTVASFATDFTFIITRKNSSLVNADGFAFAIAPNSLGTSEEGYGRWLGLVSPQTNCLSSNKIVAVEFDTFKNDPSTGFHEFYDINDNHVGLDINCVNSSAEFTSSLYPFDIRFKDGAELAARITYDGPSGKLAVHVSKNTSFQDIGDSNLVLEQNLNICQYVNNFSYVGFSGGSGSGNVDFHRITSWNFSSRFETSQQPILPELGKVCKDGKFKTLFIATASALGASAFLIALLLFPGFLRVFNAHKVKTIKRELVSLPHEIAYTEIVLATQNFSESNMLGKGGFGSVYLGVLLENRALVAVKKMSRASHQGEREFLAEVQTISKLSHRNLVTLRGWCMHANDLILVYDYMQRGSLSQALFKNESMLLLWDARYKILCGLASVLVYLHEEWEHKVVHRDIKCSNVLLDEEYNARLGDFGLARAARHDEIFRSTNVAGTMGYMAPEVGQYGKFTTASDTYSYGVVALEVVCGQEVIGNETLLLPRVEELAAAGTLVTAVDPKLHGDFDVEQATRILVTAVQCIEKDPQRRPTMRQVVHMITGNS